MSENDTFVPQYPIESGVPIPPIYRRAVRGNARIYPFETMEVGDSFFVPGTPEEPGTWVQNRVNASANYWLKRYARTRRFLTRQLADGVRCWRIL